MSKSYSYEEKIDAFIRAYVNAMLWASCDDDQVPLDKNYSIDDIAPESMKKIVAECKRFQEENAVDIATIPHRYTNYDNWSGVEQAGHDFFLTRNRHGVGFWDREYLEQDVKDRLTNNSQAYGEVYPIVGDDGLIQVIQQSLRSEDQSDNSKQCRTTYS